MYKKGSDAKYFATFPFYTYVNFCRHKHHSFDNIILKSYNDV